MPWFTPPAIAVLPLLLLVACAPSLDWRDVRPDGSAAVVLLPCKPTVSAREVQLAGGPVRLLLNACSAGGQTWALAAADMADPALVTPALAMLRTSALANLGADAPAALALQVPGATPNPESGRVAASGRLPDGAAVQAQVAVFAHGTWVFQATVLGASLPAEGVQTFFGSLRLRS